MGSHKMEVVQQQAPTKTTLMLSQGSIAHKCQSFRPLCNPSCLIRMSRVPKKAAFFPWTSSTSSQRWMVIRRKNGFESSSSAETLSRVTRVCVVSSKKRTSCFPKPPTCDLPFCKAKQKRRRLERNVRTLQESLISRKHNLKSYGRSGRSWRHFTRAKRSLTYCSSRLKVRRKLWKTCHSRSSMRKLVNKWKSALQPSSTIGNWNKTTQARCRSGQWQRCARADPM